MNRYKSLLNKRLKHIAWTSCIILYTLYPMDVD